MYINILDELKKTLLSQTENKIFLNINEYFLETLKDNISHEICLSCSSLPYFKYRIFFISQEKNTNNPFIVYLDEDIAEELNVEEKLAISAEEEFYQLMVKIMSSDKIDRVIKKLLEN